MAAHHARLAGLPVLPDMLPIGGSALEREQFYGGVRSLSGARSAAEIRDRLAGDRVGLAHNAAAFGDWKMNLPHEVYGLSNRPAE